MSRTRARPSRRRCARSIRDKTPYPVPIEDVLHGVSVFDAIVRAGKSGQIETVAG